MQAGLQLKNALYSKDQNIRAEFQQRWLKFPEDIRTFIKQNVSISLKLHKENKIYWDHYVKCCEQF